MSKSVKIFDGKSFRKLIQGVKTIQGSKIQNVFETAPPEKIPIEELSISDTRTCSFCKTNFDNLTDQREHYKNDWHRYNLKQSLRNREAISEDDFIKLADDVSSISGSDTETEDAVDKIDSEIDNDYESKTYAMNQGKIFFRNEEGKVFSLYRNLLYDKKNTPKSDDEILKNLRQYIKNKVWVVLMLGGGHFAGAVFEEAEILVHKSFHRYTVRAKQGGSQSTKDAKGGCAKSAGSNLRRYNEKILTEEVGNLLEIWSQYIDKAHIIFYRAVGPFNRSVLFSNKICELKRTDPRLRTIPFITRRPTFTEIKRVYDVLTSIDLYDSLEIVKSKFDSPKSGNELSPTRQSRQASPKNKNINRAKSREMKSRPLPGKQDHSSEESSSELEEHSLETEDLELNFENLKQFDDTIPPEMKKRIAEKRKRLKKKARIKKAMENLKNNLYNACKTGDLQTLKELIENAQKFLKEEDQIDSSKTLNLPLDMQGNTLLHVAALFNQSDLIIWLLENGSSPLNKNNKQNTPYTINPDKEIRNIFRKFAADNPEKYNYAKAQIPVVTNTLTEEEIAEKKKAQKKAKREREKEKRKENEIKRKEEDEKERFLALSDREKRALAAERRILAQSSVVLVRCFFCGQDMSGKVPFEYSGNRFCTINCLKSHRIKNPVVLS